MKDSVANSNLKYTSTASNDIRWSRWKAFSVLLSLVLSSLVSLFVFLPESQSAAAKNGSYLGYTPDRRFADVAGSDALRESSLTVAPQVTCPSRGNATHVVRGRVVYKLNTPVQSISLSVSGGSLTRTCFYSKLRLNNGYFSIRLPRGSYDIVMKDPAGLVTNYRNIAVPSSASPIIFMFDGYRPQPPKPPICPTARLQVVPDEIVRGESTTLVWSTTNASSVVIDQLSGRRPIRGSEKIAPRATTTYVLRAYGECKRPTVAASTVKVTTPRRKVSASLTASPKVIETGKPTVLRWETQNADSVELEPFGSVAASGSRRVRPQETTLYRLRADGESGPVIISVRVAIKKPETPTPTPRTPTPQPPKQTPTPKVVFDADPREISKGETSILFWDVPDAKEVYILKDGNEIFSSVKSKDKFPVSPTASTTYQLRAVNLSGTEFKGIRPVEVKVGEEPNAIVPWLMAIAIALLIAALAGFDFIGLFGGIASSVEGDEVHCTLYSAPEVNAGSDLLVQVFAHLLEQAEELDELAEELDPDAKKQRSKALKKKILRESVLTFKLMIPGVEIDEEEEDLVWRGEPDSVEFIIPIPEDQGAGKRFGKVFVYQDDEEIGKIPFRFNIMPKELPVQAQAAEPAVAGVMTKDPSAFVSYASRDKAEVYRFVQLMDELKYKFHLDIFHIDPGERWEKKLYEFIGSDDVFLLFWSKAASESKWVIKEAKLAKDRFSTDEKGLPRIVIHKVGEPADLPPWLGDIHVDRKWAEIIGTVSKETGAPTIG